MGVVSGWGCFDGELFFVFFCMDVEEFKIRVLFVFCIVIIIGFEVVINDIMVVCVVIWIFGGSDLVIVYIWFSFFVMFFGRGMRVWDNWWFSGCDIECFGSRYNVCGNVFWGVGWGVFKEFVGKKILRIDDFVGIFFFR